MFVGISYDMPSSYSLLVKNGFLLQIDGCILILLHQRRKPRTLVLPDEECK